MKIALMFFALLLSYFSGKSQADSTRTELTMAPKLSVEPGIGIHTNFGTDFLMTTLVQWNPYQRLSLGSHTSFNINNPTQRSFNNVNTEYNYSINQKFGVGTTLYGKKRTHTFMLMVGVKYTSYKETLSSPDVHSASVAIESFSPDYGLMYSFKRGWKKYFFTGRFYLPIYPWPTKDADISASDGNLHNIALELGVGIKLK
jgi:hypothetical protein